MPKGFRPEFYKENPVLHTIEILAWASTRDSFILREVLDQFNLQFVTYKDPVHEASERLRKLIKSDMLLVLTPGLIDTIRADTELRGPEITGLTIKDLEALENKLGEIRTAKGAGRKPRLYRISQSGRKYAQGRLEDLAKIRADREKTAAEADESEPAPKKGRQPR